MLLAVLSLAACGEDGDKPATDPVAATPAVATTLSAQVTDAGQLARGGEIYKANCAVCHGANAEGAPNWQRPGPDGKYPAPPLDGSGHAWHHSSAALELTIRLDFIARLAALIPKPRVNLTRFHGVFAPNSKYRALVTPARRGKGNKPKAIDEGQVKTPAERRTSMTWAQRLKRVFNIDIETCSECGGAVKVIACIEDPAVIQKLLTHLDKQEPRRCTGRLPQGRAPPAGLFG